MTGHEHDRTNASEEISVNPMFARGGETAIPRWRIPDGEMLPDSAYQIIHDEILLDGNARQNLATFVTTWMEPQAAKLYSEAFDKNMIDKDEYPQTAAIEERCVHILADLWNSPEPHTTIGTSAIGSSEACMLAGLAFKRRWEKRRRDAGEPIDNPNIVFSSSVQVVWEKFAAYWDVEPRYVPISKEHPNLTPEGMLAAVDEHTIGVLGARDPRRHVHGRLRAGEGAGRSLGRPAGADGTRRAAARRRRLRRVHRAVPRSRSGVGLPPATRAFDQRVGTQVRIGVPGPRVGRLGEAGIPAGRVDLLRELPRRRLCCSTTTSCDSVAKGTAGCTPRAATPHGTSRPRSLRWRSSSCSRTGRRCRS